MSKGQFSKLFQPGKIGTLELKNRIVMPSMGTSLATESYEVTQAQIDWFARRAKGGAGLITVERTQVASPIVGLVKRRLRADDAKYLPGLKRLAEAIHQSGAKAAIQLSVSGGAQQPPGSIPLVSPSGVPAIGRTDKPQVLTIGEIEGVVELCERAARNVKEAGFDMIEIHSHDGYLIMQFLMPYFNKRTDKYGGTFDNRCQFLMEVVDSMRNGIGPGFPLTVKYSIQDSLPDGWDVKQSQALARKLEAAGVNGINVSSGTHGVAEMPAMPTYTYPRGTFLPLVEAIREVTSLSVMAGGRLDDPELAEKTLRDGTADFICEGRALIADPDWPQKVASGRVKEIRPCLACNECSGAEGVGCVVNAVAGREGKYEVIRPAEAKKKVLVVGGGPAGMEAARIAVTRGHKVVLCEKYQQLGGLMLLGGVHNQEITAFTRWMVAQIKKLPIDVRLQTEVTPGLVEEIKPDVVILANGGTFVTPRVPGIERDNVFSAQDLLKLMNGIPVNKGILLRLSPLARRLATPSTVRRFLKSSFPVKKKVAVIGGQFPGCSLALALSHMGKKVTVIEESEDFGRDVRERTMTSLKFEVEEGNVKILTSMKIDEITDKGVVVIDKKGNKSLHEADTVVIALDLAPSESNLAKVLKSKVKEIHTIGDAKSFQRIKVAISEGYITAFSL